MLIWSDKNASACISCAACFNPYYPGMLIWSFKFLFLAAGVQFGFNPYYPGMLIWSFHLIESKIILVGCFNPYYPGMLIWSLPGDVKDIRKIRVSILIILECSSEGKIIFRFEPERTKFQSLLSWNAHLKKQERQHRTQEEKVSILIILECSSEGIVIIIITLNKRKFQSLLSWNAHLKIFSEVAALPRHFVSILIILECSSEVWRTASDNTSGIMFQSLLSWNAHLKKRFRATRGTIVVCFNPYYPGMLIWSQGTSVPWSRIIDVSILIILECSSEGIVGGSFTNFQTMFQSLLSWNAHLKAII